MRTTPARATSDTDFDRFWAAYPRKYGKGVARLQFAIAIKRTTLQTMLDAIAWQKQTPQWRKDGGAFIPKPQTWLHGEHWDDRPSEAPQLKDQTAKNVNAITEWLNRDL